MENRVAITRRTLLAALAGFAANCSRAEPAERSAAGKANLAFLGLGPQGLVNLAAFSEQNVVAVCDVDERLLPVVREQFPKAEATGDFRRVIDRRDLDGVIISTPDHSHAYLASLALARGLSVYCEKPLARTVAECDQLGRLATKTSKCVLELGHQKSARPNYRRAVGVLQRGLLGPVREVHGWTTRPHWPQGIERPGESPPAPRELRWDDWLGPAAERPFHPAYHPGKWRGWRAFGAGALGDFGHDLFGSVWEGLELGMPTKVAAETSPRNAEAFPAASTIAFGFPARGERPALRLTYYDGGRKPPESVTGGARLPDDGTLVIGERARLYLSPFDGPPRLLGPAANEIKLPDDPRPEAPDHRAAFLAAVTGQGRPASDFARAADSTRWLLLGVVAQQLGRPLSWDAARGSFNDGQADALLRTEPRRGWELPS